jgi:hypothetical protein
MTRDAFQVGDIGTLQHWERILLILSLDRVTPVWEDMGLRIGDREHVKAIIREFVTEQQQQSMDDDLVVYPRRISALINTMLDRIAEVDGDENADALATWIATTYLPNLDRERWYETWQILFLRLAEGNITQLSGQGISDQALAALTELVTRWQAQEAQIHDRIEAADALALTGWDGQQYLRYRHETPDISPLDYLSSFLKNYTFAPFWRNLVEFLSAREMSILNRWGQLYTSMKTDIPPADAAIPEPGGAAPVA